eukprot:7390147-Prymnesium_polylepis.1
MSVTALTGFTAVATRRNASHSDARRAPGCFIVVTHHEASGAAVKKQRQHAPAWPRASTSRVRIDSLTAWCS